MKSRVMRAVHGGDGNVVLMWIITGLDETCDECSAALQPGDEIAVYNDRYLDGQTQKVRHEVRVYCKPCGELLEDSLTTTEASN